MNKAYSCYDVHKIYQDTYAIRDNGFGLGDVYMYLLVGEEKALLIDSGYGLLDLKKIIRGITDKPIICACTHGHLDHALGAWQFEESYLHSLDFSVYRKHADSEFLRYIGKNGISWKPSKKTLADQAYTALIDRLTSVNYPQFKPLDDIGVIELGNRPVYWRLLPGHTQGSVAFFDRKNHAVFDGDGAPKGVWLFLEESSPLSEFIRTTYDYAAFLRNNGITRRFPGHQKNPLTIEDVEHLTACAEKALSKPNKGWKIKLSLGEARIVFSNKTMIFCQASEVL